MRIQRPGEFFLHSSFDGCGDRTGAARSGATGSDADRGRQRAILEDILETTIIPRMLLAARPTIEAPEAPDNSDKIAKRLAARVNEFSEIVITKDVADSVKFFEAQRAEGATLEQLFQDLLAPVARRLGELWEEDINDFMDVTRGVAHLQHIVQEFSTDFKNEGRAPLSNRRALLMPLPGENHSFGVSLVGEYFRRAGWRVWSGPPRSLEDILELVDGQWFDMVGLSASAVPDPAKVAADIRAIRRASHNPKVTILAGGRVFAEKPELAIEIGADGTAADGRQAVQHMNRLMGGALRQG